MIKVDKFSGHVYVETENFKQSDTGKMFIKSGDTWFGDDGQVIQQHDDEFLNISTGIRSDFGDPFEDIK